MKRLHLHVAVDDLDEAVAFYTTLFGAGPTLREPDYARWMLEDPRLNLAVSARGRKAGIDHLGVQVESDEELEGIAAALAGAGRRLVEETGAQCCYATGNKAWVADPAGILWETFRTTGDLPVYGEDNPETATLQHQGSADGGRCCPATAAVSPGEASGS